MSVPGVWEGGSDALEAGACFMLISSFLGAFLPSAPAWGRRAVLVMLHSGGTGWGCAQARAGTGLQCPNLSFLACQPCA